MSPPAIVSKEIPDIEVRHYQLFLKHQQSVKLVVVVVVTVNCIDFP